MLDPIRERRKELEKDSRAVMDIAVQGSEKVREIASQTLNEVKAAICLDYK